MARRSKPVRPTARDRRLDLAVIVLADAAEQPGLAPQPHRHEVIDGDREGAVDLGRLRQIGDVARRQAGKIDVTRQWPNRTDNALEQGRLACTIRDRQPPTTRPTPPRRSGDAPPDGGHSRASDRGIESCALISASPRKRRPRSRRSAPTRCRAARPPTAAGSTARSRPADAHARRMVVVMMVVVVAHGVVGPAASMCVCYSITFRSAKAGAITNAAGPLIL